MLVYTRPVRFTTLITLKLTLTERMIITDGAASRKDSRGRTSKAELDFCRQSRPRGVLVLSLFAVD